MIDWIAVWLTVVAFLPVAVLAGGIVLAGYYAYTTRLIRERTAAMPDLPDPALDLPQLAALARANLVEARRTLERTRDAVRAGTKG